MDKESTTGVTLLPLVQTAISQCLIFPHLTMSAVKSGASRAGSHAFLSVSVLLLDKDHFGSPSVTLRLNYRLLLQTTIKSLKLSCFPIGFSIVVLTADVDHFWSLQAARTLHSRGCSSFPSESKSTG